MEVVIKSFNGIGDLLYVTPTLRRIKEAYPECRIVVNTNFPELVVSNPFVDRVGQANEGVFLGYADPIHQVEPTKHHIVEDWEIVCEYYGLKTEPPLLQPEIYPNPGRQGRERKHVGVQVLHKGHWHQKKIWPFFCTLTQEVSLHGELVRPIPHFSRLSELLFYLAGLKLVVCAEGGIHHMAKAIGTPAIVIYGGFTKPEWCGYEDQVNLVNEPGCLSCYNPGPCLHPEQERFCLRQITVEQVLKAMDEMISRSSDA